MYDLKLHLQPVTNLHLVHGKPLHVLEGPAVVIPVVLGVAVVTAASFYLNAVFAFAIIQPGRPQIRPGFAQARSHLPIVLGSGLVVGILLGLSAVVVPRWGTFWFAFSLSIVLGLMMVSYVAVPSRVIGIKPVQSKRDKMVASAVGGAVGAVICTPPYALGRAGLILLGSSSLFGLGLILFLIGLTLQAGATGAVKTIKMSAKLLPGSQRDNPVANAGQQMAQRDDAVGGRWPADSPLTDEVGAPRQRDHDGGALVRRTTQEDRHAASSEEPCPISGHSCCRIPGGWMREHRQQRDQPPDEPGHHGHERPYCPRHPDRAPHDGAPHDRAPDDRAPHDRPSHHARPLHVDHDRHGYPDRNYCYAVRVRDARLRDRHQAAVAVDPAGCRGPDRPDRVDR
jgi:hypothetical protein